MAEKLLRVNQVAEKCGFSKSMIWAKLNPKNRRFDSDFPQPVRLSARAIGWIESELDAWIARRAENNRLNTESR